MSAEVLGVAGSRQHELARRTGVGIDPLPLTHRSLTRFGQVGCGDHAACAAGAKGQTRINHFGDDGDSPAWTSENTAGSLWSKNLEGLDGGLVAIQTDSVTAHQLTSLHDDVLGTATAVSSSTPIAVFEETEFGPPRSGAATAQRYQWIGAKARQTDSLTGVTLMGARVSAATRQIPAAGPCSWRLGQARTTIAAATRSTASTSRAGYASPPADVLTASGGP